MWNSKHHRRDKQKRSLNKGLDATKPQIHADILKALRKAERDLKAHALDTIKPFLSVENQLREADRKVRCFEAALRKAAQKRSVVRAYAEGADRHDIQKERARLMDDSNFYKHGANA